MQSLYLYPVAPDDLRVSELAVRVVDAYADHVLLHAAGRRVRRPPVGVDRVLELRLVDFGFCLIKLYYHLSVTHARWILAVLETTPACMSVLSWNVSKNS